MIENKDQGVAEKDPVFEYEKLIRKPIFIMANFLLTTILIPILKPGLSSRIHSKLNFEV